MVGCILLAPLRNRPYRTFDVSLATPCHTQDSICYFVQGAVSRYDACLDRLPTLFTDVQNDQRAVFTGDTLFVAGCGRFFEGKSLTSLLSDIVYWLSLLIRHWTRDECRTQPDLVSSAR